MRHLQDNLDPVWDKFFQHRTESLWKRFSGIYRAVVVETNDPLNMHRLRFRCPDMHDSDLKAEDCPWAMPCPSLGGKRAGEWRSACIGDMVWISFERDHPYGPVWVGFADPSRRKAYPYPSIYGVSPLSVDKDGEKASTPDDFDKKYIPKDGRPMSQGMVDRYGHADIISSVGFFPEEHKAQPPAQDHDPLQQAKFKAERARPEANKPDLKYMARITKGGQMFVMGDQGYEWQAEFKGDVDKDEKFETKRWKYIQKLINEGVPDSTDKFGDQRRTEIKTRAGHRWEQRDVGWKKPRKGEYGEADISKSEFDFRWLKWRSKGGMLYQASDMGCGANNKNYLRNLLDECAHKSEKEHKHWIKRDARWMRFVTPYGTKMVLDDRGSDRDDPEGIEKARGNGFLVKTRRTPGSNAKLVSGNPRGFQFQMNDNDKLNHLAFGTPFGQMFEQNDRYEYSAITTALGPGFIPKWRGLKENEFMTKPVMMQSPHKKAYHLILDLGNEMLSLKTRAGKGRKPDTVRNQSGLTGADLAQGLEAHDGKNGDGPWVELVDGQRRGLWFSKDSAIGIWRARRRKKMYVWMDEKKNEIVIYNDNRSGKIRLYSTGDVEVKSSKNITLDGANVSIKASESIKFQSGGNTMRLDGSGLGVSGDINAATVNAFFPGVQSGGGAGFPAQTVTSVAGVEKPEVPKKTEPSDRGKIYYKPEECPKTEITHPL